MTSSESKEDMIPDVLLKYFQLRELVSSDFDKGKI